MQMSDDVKDTGLLWLRYSQNTEQLEDRVLKHLGVPVYRDEFGIGQKSEDILPFVDGRCVAIPGNEDQWCTVSTSKDCWPEQEWTPIQFCHFKGGVKGKKWSIEWTHSSDE